MERLTENGTYCSVVDCDYESKCGMKINCYDKRLYDKLKEYEDLEEQGLLLKLPCKVGDIVWWLNGNFLMESEVVSFAVGEEIDFIHVKYLHDKEHNRYYGHNLDVGKIGEVVFLTKEEAEKALAEMEK